MTALHRVVMAGASSRDVCGVRDYGSVVRRALEAQGSEVRTCWASGPREMRALRTELVEAARTADAVFVNYSVFSFGRGGLPLAVPALSRALGRCSAPVVGILHELAHDWTGGARETSWAVAHRAALWSLVRRLDAVVLTTPARRAWFESRSWLPDRPSAFVPVPSNLPEFDEPPADTAPDCIGIFGWTIAPSQVDLVVDVIAALRSTRPAVRLCLVGAPGPGSAAATMWRASADRAGCGDALAFTGVLPRDQLAEELRRCRVLLFGDGPGPTARKGTLAGALGAAQAIVAVDGAETWSALADNGAVRLVAPRVDPIAAALDELLDDRSAARALGRRAAAFYERTMSASAVAAELRSTVTPLVAAGRR